MAATAFPAAAIVSGTIATPRLGSGTADATSFLRGDQTWAEIVTGASWGDITGTLSDQTDLQAALDAKLNESATTAYSLTLLDDADAATARATLGLGNVENTSASALYVPRIVSVDNRLPRFDGTAGVVQSSSISVDDSNNVTGVAGLTASGQVIAGSFTTVASGVATERFGRDAAPNATGLNTVVGQQAGANLTNGSGNVFVGLGTGYGITTGVDNTIIGQQSGTTTGSLSGVCLIGRSQTVSSALQTVIGIGTAQTIGHHNAICLGAHAVTSKAGQATFGRRIDCLSFQALFGGTTDRHVCEIVKTVVDSTDATRKGRMSLHAYDFGGLREGLRVEATGTAAAIGFFGATATTRQTLNAAATDATEAIALVNQIRAALIAFGLCN